MRSCDSVFRYILLSARAQHNGFDKGRLSPWSIKQKTTRNAAVSTEKDFRLEAIKKVYEKIGFGDLELVGSKNIRVMLVHSL